MFHVVLVEPEIPPNTGNISRLCAATGAMLHLVGPLGFRVDEPAVKRAGLDYWHLLKWKLHDNFDAVLSYLSEQRKEPTDLPEKFPAPGRIFAIETTGSVSYSTLQFQPGDCIFFGRETIGLTAEQLQKLAELGGTCAHIPMREPGVRSLNLSNCVALVLYEALRQGDFYRTVQ